MQLSQTGQIFSNFFLRFVNLDLILNIFKIRMTLITDAFLNLRISKDVVRKISKKSLFRGAFHKLHGKQLETLFKSERQHIYHIY